MYLNDNQLMILMGLVESELEGLDKMGDATEEDIHAVEEIQEKLCKEWDDRRKTDTRPGVEL